MALELSSLDAELRAASARATRERRAWVRCYVPHAWDAAAPHAHLLGIDCKKVPASACLAFSAIFGDGSLRARTSD